MANLPLVSIVLKLVHYKEKLPNFTGALQEEQKEEQRKKAAAVTGDLIRRISDSTSRLATGKMGITAPALIRRGAVRIACELKHLLGSELPQTEAIIKTRLETILAPLALRSIILEQEEAGTIFSSSVTAELNDMVHRQVHETSIEAILAKIIELQGETNDRQGNKPDDSTSRNNGPRRPHPNVMNDIGEYEAYIQRRDEQGYPRPLRERKLTFHLNIHDRNDTKKNAILTFLAEIGKECEKLSVDEILDFKRDSIRRQLLQSKTRSREPANTHFAFGMVINEYDGDDVRHNDAVDSLIRTLVQELDLANINDIMQLLRHSFLRRGMHDLANIAGNNSASSISEDGDA
jgi:hypothetical protein